MKIIDLHTHILPRADHGSNSTEVSIRQIELSRSASVDVIVATPHFYPHMHRVNEFVKRRASCYEKLKEKCDAEIILGAEILLCEGLNKLEGLEMLTIGNSKAILLELPSTTFKNEYERCIENLIYQGYEIILAHADRYPKENRDRLIPLGVKIQLNTNSLSGFFTKKHLIEWIDKGIVVGLGSDIHMIDKKAYASFVKARKKLGARFNEIMTKTNNLIFK